MIDIERLLSRARSWSPQRSGTSSSGPGIEFDERGEHGLGVPGSWKLFGAKGDPMPRDGPGRGD
jgi:hypothetical protein